MKIQYKCLSTLAVSGVLCLFLALPATAQRNSNGGGGGGGGGSHPSSGGSSSSGGGSRSSSGGGNSYRPSSNGNSSRPSTSSVNRPSAGSVGYRPGGTTSARVAIAPPRIYSQGIRPAQNRLGVVNGTYGTRGYVAPGTNSAVDTRGYVGQGGRASVGAGGRGFYSSYWSTRNYYHYYHGYYNTYYAPRLGFSIGFLPYGYYSFYYGDSPYFYDDGLFYAYDNNQYTVVEPPVGAEVNSLPSNAQSIVINGEQYYEANGVYYEPITKDNGTVSYQVAGKDGELNTNGGSNDQVQQAPQVGDIVTTLPPDCRKINIAGQKYYVSQDGYYYQETVDQNNNKVYKIVGTPSDEPGQ